MLIRRETSDDIDAVRSIHRAAFAATTPAGGTPVEVGLVDALRECDAWIPPLSLVATSGDGHVSGHVVCTRASVGPHPVLALGPLGVRPDEQAKGIGAALMHAVLAAADALGEPLVALLGHTTYYPRFGFRPAAGYGITAPDPTWGDYFQARTLSSYEPNLRGQFTYAKPFRDL